MSLLEGPRGRWSGSGKRVQPGADRGLVRWAHQPCSIAVPICHGVQHVFIFGLVLLVGPWILVPPSFSLEQQHKCDLRVEMDLNVLP